MEVVVGHHNGVTSAASFGDSHCVNGIDPQPLQRGVLGAKRAPQMVIDRRESTQSYRLCRARTTDSNLCVVRGPSKGRQKGAHPDRSERVRDLRG